MTITELKQTAVEVRKGIVTATHAAKSGHCPPKMASIISSMP